MDENNYSIDLASPLCLAYFLMEFERHLVFERLDPEFLKSRHEWIAGLLVCERFEDTIPFIETLSNAIREPPFYTVAIKALSEETMFRDAPMELCLLVMGFVTNVGNSADFFRSTVLFDSNLPSFDPTSFDKLVSEVSEFGDCTKEALTDFATTLETTEKDRQIEEDKLIAKAVEATQFISNVDQPKEEPLLANDDDGWNNVFEGNPLIPGAAENDNAQQSPNRNNSFVQWDPFEGN